MCMLKGENEIKFVTAMRKIKMWCGKYIIIECEEIKYMGVKHLFIFISCY
jgi:hypothetical protein